MLKHLSLLLLSSSLAIQVSTATEVKTYTLADFGLESVEPGFTLLTESLYPPLMPTQKRVHAPQQIAKPAWYSPAECVPFDGPVVGPFVPPSVGSGCTTDIDETGLIIGTRTQAGCSSEQLARTHKAANALGVVQLTGLPGAGTK